MIDKEQMDEEKPVSLIGSLVCQTFCDLIMVMWNANSVNEVKYENLVERCVRRPTELRMYGMQKNSGKLFLHEDLWNRSSCGLSFVKELCFPKVRSSCKLRAECVAEKLSMCIRNEDRHTESHVKNVVMSVSGGFEERD